MSSIPATWLKTKIGEVIDYGKTTKAEPDSIPPDAWVLELEDVEKDTSRILQRFTFQDRQSKSTKNQFSKGDVLYGKLRPYLNKVVIANDNGFCSTEIIPIKPIEGLIDGRYVFFWLKHPEFLAYVTAESHGLNMPRLGTETGRKAPFVLAPFPEQKRIADKLDNLLGRVDTCREHLDRVPQILKRFRQSVLLAAFNGLFTDSLATSVHSSNWHRFRIEGIAEVVFDGPFGSNLKSDDYTESGARVIRLENIGHLKFNDDKRTYISMEKYVYLNKHTIYPGDILFSSFVDEEVRVCVYRNKWPEVAINKADCFCIRTNRDLCDPEYLAYALACHSTYEIIKESVHGATRPRINLRQLKDFQVAIPPLPVQKLIVQKISSLFQLADDFEARHAAALKIIDKLTPSTLDKAFRGELVPQDPNDEPASNLLERIKGAMPGAKTTIRRKRSPRESEMKPMSKKSIREIIAGIPEGQFSFDEIRNKCGSDYESVKSEIFKLLSEKNPILKQSFDAKNKTMVFVRTKQ